MRGRAVEFNLMAKRVLVVAVAAIALAAVVAGSASASSVFFLRNDNIWVANADGSDAQAVTSDGTSADSYDFVSTALYGSPPLIAFHRGGGSAMAQFGTMDPNGTAVTVNPYNTSMYSDGVAFTRIDENGDKVTWTNEYYGYGHGNQYQADVVGVNGTGDVSIANGSINAVYAAAFGNTAGTSLLFEDLGQNYSAPDSAAPCGGSDNLDFVLVIQAQPTSSGGSAGTPSVYCEDNEQFSNPDLSPDGTRVTATLASTAGGSTGQIVTFPVSGAVQTGSAQTPYTAITPANSGDDLPVYSPDGTELAFDGPSNVIQTAPASGNATPATILANASNPAWSPYTLPCPTGDTGTQPNCTGASGGTCPAGQIATPPNCTSGPTGPTGTACPTGRTGTPPNCSLSATAASGKLPGGQSPVKHKHLLVTVGCTAACYVAAQATLTVGKKVTKLSSPVVHLTKAGSRRVTIKLSRALLRKIEAALKAHKPVTARILAIVTDANGKAKLAETTLGTLRIRR